MFGFLKNGTYPIGVDVGDDSLKMAQLKNNGRGISLIAGSSESRPAYVKPGSSDWQRWALETLKKLTANGKFRGKNVVAAMPAGEVFIDNIKMPKTADDNLEDVLLSKIKPKLLFKPDDAMIRHILTENGNAMVIATERTKIDRHLAIYEKAGMQIKSIAVWPVALTSTYTTFFGRRKSDLEAIVMLLDIETDCSNVVICRHKNLLFARSIPMGARQLDSDEKLTKLVSELTCCKSYYGSLYRESQIERLIFLSGPRREGISSGVYEAIAKELQMPAQMGDCLAALEMPNSYDVGIDRRGGQFSWATSFGLSLL